MLSRFNIYEAAYPESGSTLVHNTFSGGFAVLADADLADLASSPGGDRNALAAAELGDSDVAIVVASHAEEDAEYSRWLALHRARKQLVATIGVNLACNFACPYCCQAEILDGSVMKATTATAVADWLAARAQAMAAEQISLSFVGGEPLLHPEPIYALVARLRRAQVPPPTFTLITNGYLLTPELVERMAAIGLRQVQVTIDGDADSHARTRVAKNGAPTFERILANAIAASRMVEVAIKGNYRADTLAGFAPLVARLADAGLPPGSRINFTPALTGLSSREHGDVRRRSRAEGRIQVDLHDHILAAGFTPEPLEVLGPCQLGDRHSFAIDPRGMLFKCPGFFGHSEWSVGSASSGLNARYEEILTRVAAESDCAGCAHRPNCGGGCLASRWLSTERSAGDCERDYFDAIAGAAIIRSYRGLVSASAAETSAALAFANFQQSPHPNQEL